MEKPGRDNYEVWFVDYFDGKLDGRRREELFAFLSENPDLKDEFDLFQGIAAEPDLSIGYKGKERLKKETITQFNYKTWLVASVENDLNTAQANELKIFLDKNPPVKTELEQVRQAKLVADHSIIYPKKKSLHRGGKVIVLSTKRVISIAAILVLLLLSWRIVNWMRPEQEKIADQKIEKKENNTEKVIQQIAPEMAEVKKPAEKSIYKSNGDGKKERIHNSTIRRTTPEKKQDSTPINIHSEENPQLAEKKSNETSPEKLIETSPSNPREDQLAHSNEKVKREQLRFSDLFDANDLKEMGVAEVKENSEPALVKLAASELKKISSEKEIWIKKSETGDQSVTYAFAVGKFSVSHTTSK